MICVVVVVAPGCNSERTTGSGEASKASGKESTARVIVADVVVVVLVVGSGCLGELLLLMLPPKRGLSGVKDTVDCEHKSSQKIPPQIDLKVISKVVQK